MPDNKNNQKGVSQEFTYQPDKDFKNSLRANYLKSRQSPSNTKKKEVNNGKTSK